MNNKDLEFLAIDSIGDVFTNVDTSDAPSNYALLLKGSRQNRASMVYEKDYGTRHCFANYPTPIAGDTATLIDGFRFYDKDTQKEYHVVLTYDATNHYTRILVNDSASIGAAGDTNNWIELTRSLKAVVNGTPATTTTTCNINTIKDSVGGAYTLTADEVKYWICVDVSAAPVTAFLVTTNTASQITSEGQYLGSDGLNLLNGHNLLFFRNHWMFARKYATIDSGVLTMNLSLGSSPHRGFFPVEGQKKLDIPLGDSSTPPVTEYPFTIMKRNARGFFYDSSGNALITLPAGWYGEQGLNFLTSYQSTGTPAVAVGSAGDTSTTINVSDNAGTFMQMVVHYGNDTTLQNNVVGMWFSFTLLYGTPTFYQESDVFYKIYVASTLSTKSPYIAPQFNLNLSRMNKSIAGVRIYGRSFNVTESNASPIDTDDSYVFVRDYYFQQTPNTLDFSSNAAVGSFSWQKVQTSELMYQTTYPSTNGWILASQVFACEQSSSTSLFTNLQHTSYNKTRDARKPRFIVASTRAQSSINMIDKDDLTSLVSSVDGSGVHEDDNFPMASADNSGNKLVVNWRGSGPMLGLGLTRDIIYAFRNSEIESFDAQSGIQGLFPGDFISKRSLIRFPGGLAWAGRSRIYVLDESNGAVISINDLWGNYYDGSLMIDNNTGTTPYMTDTYRSAIVGGHDPYYRSIGFLMQVNKDTADGGGSEYVFARYYYEHHHWDFRKFNLSSQPTFFYQTHDGSNGSSTDFAQANRLIVGYGSGLVEYPYFGSQLWFDAVATNDTGGNGVESDLWFNVNNLHNQVSLASLNKIMLEYQGSTVSGSGQFQVRLYANQEISPWGSPLYFFIDKVGQERNVPERGGIWALKVRVTIPSSTIGDVKNFSIQRILLGFRKNVRLGNQ